LVPGLGPGLRIVGQADRRSGVGNGSIGLAGRERHTGSQALQRIFGDTWVGYRAEQLQCLLHVVQGLGRGAQLDGFLGGLHGRPESGRQIMALQGVIRQRGRRGDDAGVLGMQPNPFSRQ
jgi:hypothetical protein